MTMNPDYRELLPDTDMDLPFFHAYLGEVVPAFVKFMEEGIKSGDPDFKSALTKAEWMEELQGFVDMLDGEHEDDGPTNEMEDYQDEG